MERQSSTWRIRSSIGSVASESKHMGHAMGSKSFSAGFAEKELESARVSEHSKMEGWRFLFSGIRQKKHGRAHARHHHGGVSAVYRGVAGCTMGLLSIIRKQKLKDQEIRLLVLGLDNAGKTTIVRQLMGADTTLISPTMGFQIHTFPYRECQINAWDIGGQTTLRSFWGNYFDKLDAILWVVDGTSLERLAELYLELREKVIQQDQLAGIFFCILVNKMDLIDEADQENVRQVVISTLNLQKEIPEDKYIVECVSGRTGKNITGFMDWIVQKVVV